MWVYHMSSGPQSCEHYPIVNDYLSRRSREAEGGVETVRKPTMIAEYMYMYNNYMVGVDNADHLVTY